MPKTVPTRSSAGFSLIEVLVSIVVLSIGLLGTAGLMSASLKNTNTAFYRSQATFLADDIVDRLRANLTAARNGQYNMGPLCAPGAGAMAAYDCTEWMTAVAQTLPGGAGTVLVDNNRVVTITITWVDPSSGDDNSGIFVTE